MRYRAYHSRLNVVAALTGKEPSAYSLAPAIAFNWVPTWKNIAYSNCRTTSTALLREGKHKGEFPEGVPTITTAEVAEAHWKLHQQREVAETLLP